MKIKYWAIIILAVAAICASVIYYIKQPINDIFPMPGHHIYKIK